VSSASAATLPPAARGVRIRWKIFAFLFAFGFLGYLEQRGITVASVQLMPQLSLSQMQLSWLEQALLVGYTLMQFPGGVIGQRLGARRMFVIIGLLALAATLATPLAPVLFSGATLFAVLLTAQLLLGAAQAPIFPVSAGVFESWFPPRQWPLVQGLQSMGLGLGNAVTPPLIAWLMSAFGWQRALVWTALPALIVIAWWAWFARDTPTEHEGVSSAEMAELGERPPPASDRRISWQRVWELVRDRDVLALTASYLCMNYVFYLLTNWCFLYLVQERHFTVLESGLLAGTPPLAAAVGAGLGGKLASVFSVRYGVRIGLRLLPLLSLPAAGVLLLIAVSVSNPYLAVVALALCYFAVELNEGPYWAAIMHVGRADSMTASGLLNTGGNAGGLVATPVVGYLSGHHSWSLAFQIGAVFAFASAAAWLLIDPDRRDRLA
jgi:MFS transporter, ACS family, glucarate transporter